MIVGLDIEIHRWKRVADVSTENVYRINHGMLDHHHRVVHNHGNIVIFSDFWECFAWRSAQEWIQLQDMASMDGAVMCAGAPCWSNDQYSSLSSKHSGPADAVERNFWCQSVFSISNRYILTQSKGCMWMTSALRVRIERCNKYWENVYWKWLRAEMVSRQGFSIWCEGVS